MNTFTHGYICCLSYEYVVTVNGFAILSYDYVFPLYDMLASAYVTFGQFGRGHY